MIRIYDPTDDPAEENARILAMSYEVVVLEDRPHEATAEVAEALLEDGIGKVAVIDARGTPLIIGDRKCREKPWVDLETGAGWWTAGVAITAILLRRARMA